MNWKQLLLLLILSGGALLLMSRSNADPARSEFVPEHLHGVWRTRDPSYQGRFVELGPRLIAFGVGAQGYRREHGVLWIEPNQLSAETLFTVNYLEDDGTESRLELAYSPRRDQLRFTSRPMVHWQRLEILQAEDERVRRRAEEESRVDVPDPFGDEFDQLFAGPIWEGDQQTPAASALAASDGR